MSLVINSYFAKSGLPEIGLTPSIRIWEVDENGHSLVIGSPDPSMVEIGDGFYKYVFLDSSGYDETKNYIIRADGDPAGTTLSQYEKYSVASTNEQKLSQTTINSIVDSTWDETASNHMVSGTTGEMLNKIKADTTLLVADHITQISLLELLLKFETNKTAIDKNAATLTVFDDDGITPLQVFYLKDSNNQPSVAEICIRDPQ
jgi:hypothetical protein